MSIYIAGFSRPLNWFGLKFECRFCTSRILACTSGPKPSSGDDEITRYFLTETRMPCAYCWQEVGDENKSLHTSCCGRVLCLECQKKRGRVRCIYCPIMRESLASFSQVEDFSKSDDDFPPPYEPRLGSSHVSDNKNQLTGVMHYVRKDDSVHSVALKYQIPMEDVRKCNHLFSDHLLQGRNVIWIPNYAGPIKSNPDIEDERKSLLKRFQIKTKCVDYQIALAYMSANDFHVDKASVRYAGDVAWEKAHLKHSVGSL